MSQQTPVRSINEAKADQALKAKHRAIWASGDYPAVAAEVVGPLGPVLVGAVGVRAGEAVADLAAGSGNAAIPAARAGGRVVASDLTPTLVEAGRRRAAAAGVELVWEVADAEALPYADGQFDVVMSCIGVMFAPHHQLAADELVRVVRSGGRVGLLAWTPTGFIGQLFATLKPYAPPPPPGASPAPLWGSEEHVRQLLGDRVDRVQVETRTLEVTRFGTAEAFRDYFTANYGPVIAVQRFVADDPDKGAALARDLTELARRFDQGDGRMEWDYLLLTARRR